MAQYRDWDTRMKEEETVLGRIKHKIIDSSEYGMLSDLNDFAHNQWNHLKLSTLFAAGAMFPVLAYNSIGQDLATAVMHPGNIFIGADGNSLSLGFVAAAAVTGYVVSIRDNT